MARPCHCMRGCMACTDGPCSCGLVLPAALVARRERPGPAFRRCERGHWFSGPACTHCAELEKRGCGCPACEPVEESHTPEVRSAPPVDEPLGWERAMEIVRQRYAAP